MNDKMNIKTNCVACGSEIVEPDKNYIVRGNYCPRCSRSCTGKSVKKRLEEIEAVREEESRKKQLLIEA